VTKGRICEICGFRLVKGRWQAIELPIALKELGFEGKWAHASCVVKLAKYREAQRKLRGLDYND
jgi:hypothetical protein